MNEAETLVKKITEGIQEKKGKNIVIADLTAINDTICSYFVICQGNSPSQVTAIVDSVKEYVHKEINDKPTGIDGLRNAEWVAQDRWRHRQTGTCAGGRIYFAYPCHPRLGLCARCGV